MDYINPASLDDHFNDSIELYHETCYFCNGFYGPCFGEPICGPCHDFLYTEEPQSAQHHGDGPFNNSLTSEKDDGDSGNDEPSEDAAPPPPVVAFPAVPMNNDEMDVAEGIDPDPGLGPHIPQEENENEIDMNPGDEVVVEIEEMVHEPVAAEGVDEFVNLFNGAIEIGIVPDPNPIAIPGHSRDSPSTPPNPNQLSNLKTTNRLAQLSNPLLPHEMAPTEDKTLKLPPEIWAGIFTKLDPVSILMSSKVCRRWKTMIKRQYPDTFWMDYIKSSWPLFQPVYAVQDWLFVCSELIDSLPCKHCFIGMNGVGHLQAQAIGRVAGQSLRSVRLQREIKWLLTDHPEGIEAVSLDPYNYNWLARVNGPPESPYQGGVFYLNLKIPAEYPIFPPKVRFLTKIFHPNISRHGDIGIDCLQHNWTLALTISQILLSVQSLMTDPFTELSMEPSISELYDNDRESFNRIARIWTWKYAMHDILIH